MPVVAAPRGKRIALLAGTVAVIALAVAVLASWDRLREEWYIWRVSSTDLKVSREAAEALGSLRSVRAIPELVRLLEEEKLWPLIVLRSRELPPGKEKIILDPISYALCKIGPAALPRLRHAVSANAGVREVVRVIELGDRVQPLLVPREGSDGIPALLEEG